MTRVQKLSAARNSANEAAWLAWAGRALQNERLIPVSADGDKDQTTRKAAEALHSVVADNEMAECADSSPSLQEMLQRDSSCADSSEAIPSSECDTDVKGLQPRSESVRFLEVHRQLSSVYMQKSFFETPGKRNTRAKPVLQVSAKASAHPPIASFPCFPPLGALVIKGSKELYKRASGAVEGVGLASMGTLRTFSAKFIARVPDATRMLGGGCKHMQACLYAAQQQAACAQQQISMAGAVCHTVVCHTLAACTNGTVALAQVVHHAHTAAILRSRSAELKSAQHVRRMNILAEADKVLHDSYIHSGSSASVSVDSSRAASEWEASTSEAEREYDMSTQETSTWGQAESQDVIRLLGELQSKQSFAGGDGQEDEEGRQLADAVRNAADTHTSHDAVGETTWSYDALLVSNFADKV
jgi:hypothetical protein